MFSVPTCAKGFPGFTAISSLSSRTTPDHQLVLSLCVSHSLSSCNVGIPAVRPNNKGCAPCLWTITSSTCPYMELCIAEARKKGVCLLVCVWPSGVYMSECLKDVAARRERFFFLDVCNVWNICHCSGGRAVGEERQGSSSYSISSWLSSAFVIYSSEEGGEGNRLAELIRVSWMKICNRDGCWRTRQDV